MPNTTTTTTTTAIDLLLLGSTPACISWQSGREVQPAATRARPVDAAALLAQTEARTIRAGDRAGLEALIRSYEAVLQVDRDNPRALAALAGYHTLMGTGYQEDTGGKEHHFRLAIQSSERLMVLNPAFRARVERGAQVWDAVEALTAIEADAMGWWSTAVFYYFEECVPGVFKPLHNAWLERNKKVMTRLEEVAPEWNGGGNLFNWGIYYLAQDPRETTGDPYPWNVYFQREARQLLDSADAIF